MIYFSPLNIKRHWEWVHERAQPLLCEDTCGIVALDDSGALQAAAIFDSFTKTTCVTHFAIEKPMVLRSGFLREVAHMLFNDLNRKKIFGMTPSDNARALRFNKHIGWTEIYRIKDAYDEGVDYVLQEMTRADCKWLDEELREAG